MGLVVMLLLWSVGVVLFVVRLVVVQPFHGVVLMLGPVQLHQPALRHGSVVQLQSLSGLALLVILR